jgi:hypothetical protein
MMAAGTVDESPSHEFYRNVLERMNGDGVRFLVGGAFALEHYTGVTRRTKDIDLFVHPAELQDALRLLAGAGYETEVTSPIWLGKARCGDDFVDVIFSSGNGIAEVDEDWFTHAVAADILGVRVKLCPPEEMIWSKSFVMERERYDGADVTHIIRACGARMDWQRVLTRFDDHWRVLLAHLVLFGFVYPGERTVVPEWVMRDLGGRLEPELGSAAGEQALCRGTLLSRHQYRIDLDRWGYEDGRIRPSGKMTRGQARAIDREA